MSVEHLVESLRGDPLYVKFLLVELPYIRSALEARGVCLDDEYRASAYSTSVGNALHLDILDLSEWLFSLSPQDRKLLVDWAANDAPRRPAFSRARVSYKRIQRANHLIVRYAKEQADER
jgi:hypothetical protein